VNQPLGLMVFVAVVGALSLVLVLLISGQSCRPLLTRRRVMILTAGFGIMLLASWFYKLAPS